MPKRKFGRSGLRKGGVWPQRRCALLFPLSHSLSSAGILGAGDAAYGAVRLPKSLFAALYHLRTHPVGVHRIVGAVTGAGVGLSYSDGACGEGLHRRRHAGGFGESAAVIGFGGVGGEFVLNSLANRL